MQIEKEIEFKTEITKNQYDNLISKFQLEKNIYKITNHYFETANKSLMKSKKTLRIRIKDDKEYTLTLKEKANIGTNESNLTLKEKDALEMLYAGFNLKDLFLIDVNVYPYGKLTTYRVSIPYKEGELFFDKFEYYGITKYEIEYEAKYYGLGYKIFTDFLKAENIKFIPTMKKSRRVFQYLKDNRQ